MAIKIKIDACEAQQKKWEIAWDFYYRVIFRCFVAVLMMCSFKRIVLEIYHLLLSHNRNSFHAKFIPKKSIKVNRKCKKNFKTFISQHENFKILTRFNINYLTFYSPLKFGEFFSIFALLFVWLATSLKQPGLIVRLEYNNKPKQQSNLVEMVIILNYSNT